MAILENERELEDYIVTEQVREVTYNICKKYQIEKEQKAIK